jgi:methionyl-tRNA formyltransferase
MTEATRFVVLGSGGAFTFHVIKTLLDQSFIPLAYIQSGRQPVPRQSSFNDIELEIPQRSSELHQLLNLHSSIAIHYESEVDLKAFIYQFDVEYLLVACWPRLVSDSIIESVSKAALNLHPSLLPKFRGYDPIGDQLAKGNEDFGITLHLLNDRYDEGDIVLQRGLSGPPDFNAAHINQISAIEGAKLFIQAVKTQRYPGWSLTAQ